MTERLSEISQKDVINICDGSKLGNAEDFELDLCNCCVTALVVPGPCRFFGLLAPKSDYVIPWRCVKKVGNDTILVEVDAESVEQPREKKKLL